MCLPGHLHLPCHWSKGRTGTRRRTYIAWSNSSTSMPFRDSSVIQVLQWWEEYCYVFLLSPLRAIHIEHGLFHYSCYTEKNVPNPSPLDSTKSLFHYHPRQRHDLEQRQIFITSIPRKAKLYPWHDCLKPRSGQCEQRIYVAIPPTPDFIDLYHISSNIF